MVALIFALLLQSPDTDVVPSPPVEVLEDPLCAMRAIGDPCREGCISISHGFAPGYFQGRVVVRSSSGKLRPVRDVSFFAVGRGGDQHALQVHVGRRGQFKHPTGVKTSVSARCEEGKTQL
jgi:hypothetical protein